MDAIKEVEHIAAPLLPVVSARYINDVLDSLNSFDPATRVTALRRIERLVHEPQSLVLVARQEAARYRRRTLRGTLLSLGSVGATVVCAWLFPDTITLFAVAVMALAMAFWLSVYIPIRARRTLIGVLEQMTDPLFLGPALTMLVPDGVTEVKATITTNSVVRSGITSAIRKMLPQIRADHRDLLTKDQMQTLLVLMKQHKRDPDLTVRILRALQQIGDESARSAVQSLTRSHYHQVRQTAQETLEFLALRAHEKQQSQTLLRASDGGNAAGQEQLLRSANGTGNDAVSEQLLRPQS